MAKPTNAEIEAKRAVIAEAHEQALQAKAETIRVKAHNKAENIRRKADAKAKRAIAKGEAHAAKIEGIVPAEIERKIRLDVHGRPKPLLRGWIHAIATPLALAAGIVLICLAHGTGLKWACAVFMTCSLVLFGNSACYHLGDWSPRVTDVLRRIDHMNIFLLIAGTYTPVSFALTPFWRDSIIAGMWICTTVALIIHVIWISAPRWLYVLVYIIFRRVRRRVHGIVLDVPLCRTYRGDTAVCRRRLLYRRSHRVCAAQARPLAEGVRLP